MTLQSS